MTKENKSLFEKFTSFMNKVQKLSEGTDKYAYEPMHYVDDMKRMRNDI